MIPPVRQQDGQQGQRGHGGGTAAAAPSCESEPPSRRPVSRARHSLEACATLARQQAAPPPQAPRGLSQHGVRKLPRHASSCLCTRRLPRLAGLPRSLLKRRREFTPTHRPIQFSNLPKFKSQLSNVSHSNSKVTVHPSSVQARLTPGIALSRVTRCSPQTIECVKTRNPACRLYSCSVVTPLAHGPRALCWRCRTKNGAHGGIHACLDVRMCGCFWGENASIRHLLVQIPFSTALHSWGLSVLAPD